MADVSDTERVVVNAFGTGTPVDVRGRRDSVVRGGVIRFLLLGGAAGRAAVATSHNTTARPPVASSRPSGLSARDGCKTAEKPQPSGSSVLRRLRAGFRRIGDADLVLSLIVGGVGMNLDGQAAVGR